MKRDNEIRNKFFTRFAIFIFSVYVLSSLISMHIRLICHVDIDNNNAIIVKKKEKEEFELTPILSIFFIEASPDDYFFNYTQHFIRISFLCEAGCINPIFTFLKLNNKTPPSILA